MLYSLPANQPVTKVRSNCNPDFSRTNSTQNSLFDILYDEDEDDFLSAPLDDIDFNDLTIEEDKEFSYDEEDDDFDFDEEE